MKTVRMLSVATLLATSVGAQAAGISYDYVEGSFGEYDEADALYIGGSKGLDKQFGILGSFGILDHKNLEVTAIRGGGFFHTPIQKNLDFFATLELVWTDFESEVTLPFFGTVKASDDDIGFAAAGGMRFAVQDNLQVEGKLTLTEVDPYEDGLGINLNGRYFFNKQLSGALGLASDAEFDGLYLNLRYDLK
ncbi:MAG: hypothetical protein ACOY33_11385 [Pseudomonadota bacterium]